MTIYDFKVLDRKGNEVDLADYRGKVLLVVNTATGCGFTPHYAPLEEMYEKFHDQGFEVLDFPCNQFGAQAPGTIAEIHEFCTATFAIEFPQFDKIDVNGDGEHPLFSYLKARQGFGGFNTEDPMGKRMDEMLKRRDADYASKSDIKWNFTKFLVTADGRVVKRYEPTHKMADIEADISALLN